MRELEVLRVESEGKYVVCIDRATDEQFRLRADDDLRAAARGDTTELGQMPVSGDAALRPREIQARIRAGASVAELAEIAGVSPSKIDRYAHPVLLERARAAELARASHPLTMDGPSLATLGELVAECLVLRGEVPADARWDSWKSETGQWVVQLSFHEGPIENWAHWRFQPGTHGGMTDPIDELAIELTDPALAREARRTRLAAVPPATPAVAVVPPLAPEPAVPAPVVPAPVVAPPVDSESANPTPAPLIPAPAPLADVLDLQYSTETTQVLEPILDFAPDTVEAQTVEPDQETDTANETADGASSPEAASPEAASPEAAPSKFQRELAERKRPGAEGDRTAGSKHRAKRAKPAVPAWEDVLLGVRAHPED